MVAPNLLLEQLGREHGATKTTHGYLRRYAELFDQRRERITSVLEIGVQEGGSLRMWEEYFPNANIYGVDIDPTYKKHEGERRTVIIGSSTDPATVDLIQRQHSDCFDIIIDDGSHHPADQLATFELFFPLVKDGGFYSIEDIGHTQGPLRLVVNTRLAELIEAINYWPRGTSGAELFSTGAINTNNYWIKHVTGIRFYRGLSIVEKGNNLRVNARPSSTPAETKSVSRPRFRASRLRELRLPWQFRKRRFVKRHEVRPEPQWRLLLRWLTNRW